MHGASQTKTGKRGKELSGTCFEPGILSVFFLNEYHFPISYYVLAIVVGG